MKFLRYLTFCFFLVLLLFAPIHSNANSDYKQIEKLIGNSDAVLLANPAGDILLSINPDKKLVPASTLKLLTALVAIHYLGEDFRFQTDFYLDANSNLKIKGSGDPLLLSENISQISAHLCRQIKTTHDIILDDTFFEKPVRIPGTVLNSLQPYDAPNGALCVNFNTVNFKRRGKTYVSAEPQTPLLDIAKKHIRSSKAASGRIMLTHDENEITRYAGYLFKYFIKSSGCPVTGDVKIGTVNPSSDQHVYRYVSFYKLTEGIARLLEYSNNFIANQIFLASGAKVFGPPASMDKAVRAALNYVDTVLNIKDVTIVEGSGISRRNRLSAGMLLEILFAFKPYCSLMQHKDGEYYKTGTLNGINTRAGYLENSRGELYPFVVLINTPGKNTAPVMKQLKSALNQFADSQ